MYFDNTSIGTSTNNKGAFEIKQREGISSALVVSFLGYEKVVIDTYDSNEFYDILLNESIDSLDEIVISTNDGMPREIKLEQFRKQFLGFSKFAKSCKILNEYDVILRYKKSSKELIATAKSPIIIQNEELQYLVCFDIKSFVIEYNFV
ncbi:carboxypeptidase-like regulatory domain-containing protein [Psychroserpens ponticola]|uniref:Carboxypeptidase-like regulatory domain-containing protein n=1 Tax=Psychroserpens ponticola TaxID=2932268 RepID=A0ABY7S2S2_9FLAO|nr:carboxypeptidase-like regulatory domain-containing protein [Psychroserpens ponticola]WCO03704.1 carboxypeptidase-like regulatory domain-containing protein [Psychroserpens ponticola]